jgi:hypothetical protein
MRVQLKESKVNNLPRRAFLKSFVGLIAAPAVVKAENLMPIVVWRPPVVRREGWVLYNGATLKADKFPDLFNYFGGWKGETTVRLPDETLGFWISEFPQSTRLRYPRRLFYGPGTSHAILWDDMAPQTGPMPPAPEAPDVWTGRAKYDQWWEARHRELYPPSQYPELYDEAGNRV